MTDPILTQRHADILEITLNRPEAFNAFDLEMMKLLAETLAGDFPRRPQDESQVTHARKLTKEDGRVDWTKPAIEIERQIRAFTPWPGAFAYLGDLMVKLWKAEVVNSELRLLEVQPANGKRMSFEAFQRGHPDALEKEWR